MNKLGTNEITQVSGGELVYLMYANYPNVFNTVNLSESCQKAFHCSIFNFSGKQFNAALDSCTGSDARLLLDQLVQVKTWHEIYGDD